MFYKLKEFMKKNLLILFTVLCTLSLFSSCKDDEKPDLPPKVEDVLATYSDETLKAKVNGTDASSDAKVEITQAEDKSVTINLFNIVPGAEQFAVPNATFDAVTKTAYISKLTGEASSGVLGFKVEVDGTVENKILSVDIKMTELTADSTNTSELYGLVYKGKMNILVSNIPDPIEMEQRVYVSKVYKDTSMVKLTIKNFAFGDMVLGNIALDTILVQKRGDALLFAATDRTITLKTLGEVTIDLSGNIVGDAMKLDLKVKAGPLDVDVAFAGSTVLESTTAKIEKITTGSTFVADIDMSTSGKATLKIWDNATDADKLITLKCELTEGATVDSVVMFSKSGVLGVVLKEGDPIDFTKLEAKKGYVRYYLTAQDPNSKGTYSIYWESITEPNLVFTMEEWIKGEPVGLATSNQATAFFPLFGLPKEPTPVTKDGDNNAAKIVTRLSVTDSAHYTTTVPAITAGTLFTGVFKLSLADLDKPLSFTKFGVPYRKEPKSFKVTYQYTPGKTYYKTVLDSALIKVDSVKTKYEKFNNAVEVKGATDFCSIIAYLYEGTTLDGTNINTSETVIAKAILTSSESMSSAKDVEIDFAYTKPYLAGKQYKVAIVASSSKNGDKYEGAPESTLIISHLEIVAK